VGRDDATGRGVSITVREAAKVLNLDLKGARMVVQGYGNVGSNSALLLAAMGCKLIGVGDESGAWHNPDGIDPVALKDYVRKNKGLAKGFAGLGKEIDRGTLLEIPCEILVPAALENQITEKNVARIKPRILAEGANGPTTPEAEKVIHERGIIMIPDFLANAGGVTCSYFEQVQCNMNYFWEKDEVLGKLDTKMTSAFNAVNELAKKRKLYMRDAAYVIAVGRVAQACKGRGWV
jgi:glutamate dehydrogenase/leucine dehydrogenase